MFELLYLIFIAPLETIMKGILELSYGYTQSYGFSIIILSLCVNIILLPLYHMAEKWQVSERSIQLLMQPYSDFIKQSFKKQERYAMLSILYRQYGYHPIMAMRASFGFLIQVPFFF